MGSRDERTEVGVLHGLACGDSLGVVVAQHLVEQVERLWRHQVLVLRVHEAFPALLAVPPEKFVEAGVQLHLVLVDIFEEFVGAEHLCDSHQLSRTFKKIYNCRRAVIYQKMIKKFLKNKILFKNSNNLNNKLKRIYL